MRLRLLQRFNLLLGGIFFLGMITLIYFDATSSARLLEEIGFSEAEQLAKAAYHQLTTSMKLGGGRTENREIIARFRDIEGVDYLRVIHGEGVSAQYGVEEDELPQDEMERRGLEGREIKAIENPGGYRAARFVMPVFLKMECLKCHVGEPGMVNGVVSISISLKKYEDMMSGHMRDFILWGGGIFLSTAVAIILTVQRRLLEPIARLKDGIESLSRGDLSKRVHLKSDDELQDLGDAFNQMGESLFSATGKLKELGDRHSKLVEMAADAIVVKEMETGRYMDCNPAALTLTGYLRGELVGMTPSDIYQPRSLDEYDMALKRWVHDGKGYLYDAEVRRKDGASVPVEVAASVLEIGGKRYMQEIWRDTSERKAYEEMSRKYILELEKTVDERTADLNRSLKDLEDAYGKLKDSEKKLIESAKLVSLGEMGAGIAHELNSPLAGILSIAEVLLGRVPGDDRNHMLLEKIKDAAVRSKYIILDMLAYARPFKGELSPFFLNETIKATLTLFVSEIKTGSIEIIEDFDPELPKIYGNKGQIMEALLNIIKNARDAMKEGGRIYISTGTEKAGERTYAFAEIKDTGPGIPDEIMDRIFDPFFSTKEKGGGLNIGLGLSIADSIVKGHGGKIKVEGKGGPGFGAVLRVLLPVHEEHA